jgi:hypothetical protein
MTLRSVEARLRVYSPPRIAVVYRATVVAEVNGLDAFMAAVRLHSGGQRPRSEYYAVGPSLLRPRQKPPAKRAAGGLTNLRIEAINAGQRGAP